MKKLEWRIITRNCWQAVIPGTKVYLTINRNRSWKALRDPFPFKLTILGQQFGWPEYATLADAEEGAEKHARSTISALSAWARGR